MVCVKREGEKLTLSMEEPLFLKKKKRMNMGYQGSWHSRGLGMAWRFAGTFQIAGF